jgi:hypothetical protein
MDQSLISSLDVGRGEAPKFPLVVGEDYLVVAVALGPHTPWFFVHDRFNGARVPIAAPSLLFSIHDSRPSKQWVLGQGQDRHDSTHAVLAPAFWAADPLFHGRMFEGDADALKQMEDAVREMLMEWPLSWVKQRALSAGTDCWVSDQEGNDTWEADPNRAMTVNPKTGRLFHNPLFVAGS